jgi:DNA polymerase-1
MTSKVFGNVKLLTEIPVDIKKGQMVSFDIEMMGQTRERLHRPHGTFACISIAVEGREELYQLYDTADLKKLFLSAKNALWVGHNMLYDLRQLMRFVEIKPRYIHDTMLLEQAMFGGYYQNFSLKDLVRRYLGIVMEKEVRDEFEEATAMTQRMKEYAALDAKYTLDIALLQRSTHEGAPGYSAYRDIDEKMIWPVLDIKGIPVDVEAWTKATDEFQEIADKLQGDLGFNVNSRTQVINACKKEGIHLQNTQAATLEAYKDYAIIDGVLKTRMYRKATSTYGLKWLEKYVEDDGKVYSSWHITGAETGRMSSSNPNGQNIPARKLPIFRTFFTASPGNRFIVDDVSQQEPCILAYESKDKVLTNAIMQGEDLHLAVAREIFNDPSMPKSDDRRAVGKTINLGTAYGLSAIGCAKKLNIELEQAEKFLQQYFARFTGVFTWIAGTRANAYQTGFVKTASGRRIFLNTYNNQWQNNAINSPIQGGAADFTKMWVRKYWEKCNEYGVPYSLCLIVHDELGLDVPKEAVKETNRIRKEAFTETAETLFPGIPFKSESVMGANWGVKQTHEEDEDESE